jgi:hypothetical protein
MKRACHGMDNRVTIIYIDRKPFRSVQRFGVDFPDEIGFCQSVELIAKLHDIDGAVVVLSRAE